MLVRGAPLIGATAAYGMALAMRADASDAALDRAYKTLMATRPTAINLRWALDAMRSMLRPLPPSATRGGGLFPRRRNRRGRHRHQQGHRPAWPWPDRGDRSARKKPGERVNMLTHCNAGWLATVDWGTALAPIYLAHDRGIAGPCLGRRDPPAQPGRLADRLGTRPARRAAHRHCRQCRRPPDAARHGRSRDRRHRPGHRQRRRLQQDRHLSEGARRAGQWRAVLCGAAVADHRLERR